MDNLGMFSDAYPACPFPKSFSFQIKKIGEPVKTTSNALPDSTEDIKMFDSPERDSEDFERSLKKTMECIAQVCDTTVPDPTSTSLKPSPNPESTPLKPPYTSPPRQPHSYLQTDEPPGSPKNHIIEHIGREETVGPMTCKKFNTPPHHPYQRPKRVKPDRTAELEENWLEARESWERKQKTASHQDGPGTYRNCNEQEPDRKLLQYNPSETDRKPMPHYQTDPTIRSTMFPGLNLPPGLEKKNNPHPEHFIFPECNQDLQKEFFMFYMQKCLQQNMMEPPPYPPPYSAHGGPSTGLMTSRNTVMTSQASPLHQEKRFVDSTTSPIHPRFLENKENFSPSAHVSFPPDQSCKYNSPPVPNQGQEVKPQRLHFNFPSPVPPPDQTGQPPYPPGTPNPGTPIMGPSLEQSAAVLGPSPGYYSRSNTGSAGGYPRTDIQDTARMPQSEHSRIPQSENSRLPQSEQARFPHSEHSRMLPPHHHKLPVSLAESSTLSDRAESLSSIRPTIQQEQQGKTQDLRDSRSDKPYPDQTPRDMIPDGPRDFDRGSHPGELTKLPERPAHIGGRPPNLPSHLFPNDTRPLQFHTPPPTRGFQPPLPPAPRSANLPSHHVRQDLLQSMRSNVKQESLPQLDMGYFDPARNLGEHGLSRNTAGMSMDKAIPDNLAAGYLPYPDLINKPYFPSSDLFSSGSAKERFNFSFKETIGKMLSKKKPGSTSESNPTGKRTKFSNEQIRVLEHYYHNVNKYVTGSNKGTLCQVTGLELSTILMWFQNKRAREKKQKTNV
ncbi:hypothetical protein ACHWQZ_G015186 [Mnemiopsis leidyi]